MVAPHKADGDLTFFGDGTSAFTRKQKWPDRKCCREIPRGRNRRHPVQDP